MTSLPRMTDVTAQTLDGAATLRTIKAELAERVSVLREQGVVPGLGTVLVGDDPGSHWYVGAKHKDCAEIGITSIRRDLPATASQAEVEAVIDELNADDACTGFLVQQPTGLDEFALLSRVDPDKDVDGLHVVNAGRLMAGLPALVACTPSGCMILLRETLGDLTGKRAVVVGRSLLVGKPIAQLLLAADCTVTMAHSKTVDLPAVCREADILVAAVGRPEMIRGDWIKPGAAVIDVGMNRIPARDPEAAAAGKTRLVGDVAFDEAREVAGWITPVPGGVGPMTVACLLQNTLTAAKRLNGIG